ncbi:MAG: imidazole glycerol phosphate synthase subunit HisF [Deltaproteobacteria bacterium]|nr:imidazole glycerol phosphate synthase subunit HisF [Deltaproteobacteria bacterium]
MLTRRIIPCLDVADGRIVKGVRFQGLRDAGDPLERALDYQRQGADELVVLDVSATVAERAHQTAVIRRLRAELNIPLTAGGGVRSAADAQRLLEAGADKVAINTAAVLQPALLTELSARFGAQCTVIAIDARRHQDSWEVVINAGRDSASRDALQWIGEAEQRGAGEVLLTSWDRDGTLSGYDLELLRAASSRWSLPIIASGGAKTADHLVEAFEAGADAVLAASIFHDRDTTVSALKAQLFARGIEVRR